MTLSLFDGSPIVPAPSTVLRPYQSEAIKTLQARYREGKRRMLVVAPVGAGKMVMIAALIKSSPLPALFVAHRMELINQCVDQLSRQGLSHIGVMRADDDRTDPSATIQVASVATLARRTKPEAGIIFIDEAHRGVSDQYVEHIFEAYPNAIIFGFTASPCRLDGKPLGGKFFQSIDVVATYHDLAKASHIVFPEAFGSPIELKFSGVKTTMGDYNEQAIADIIDRKELHGQLVSEWKRLAGGRRTIAFAINVEHSKHIVERFREEGVRAEHVDGTTPEEERLRILADLAAGRIDVVSNCNVLLEGVDIPSVKCVVHARPTKSLTLWIQSVGRSMRPWCSICDKNCGVHPSVTPVLLDHAGNWDEHGAPFEDRLWSLHDRPGRQKGASKAYKICKKCFAYVDGGRYTCPYCGAEFERPKKSIEETNEQLQKKIHDPEALKRAYFDKMVAIARKNGFKPGFPSWRFKEEYGNWPPRAWSDTTNAQFAGDEYWQLNLARRNEMQADIRKEPTMQVGEDPADVGVEPNAVEYGDQEEDFGDWLESEGI